MAQTQTSVQTDAGTQIVIPANARVGLVLSGGGARGLAHAGVLRVLEAQGIHPEIVTGTSMGAIIGALYASGRSAEEIEHIARNLDWHDALSDSSPREQQLYPFRELEAGTTADLRMSITPTGIAFPRGAIEGQHLQQVLDELFQHDGGNVRIESLPRRFAAVATDLETGAAVVLDHGDLVQAVRASMSIPGALAPVQRSQRLLVDGGMTDNMPVELAQKMGATFIIAVDVSTPLYTRDELDSVVAVASQISNFLVRINTAKQHDIAAQHGVVIVPQLSDFDSTDFDRANAIIAAGAKAARLTLHVAEQAPAQKTTQPEPADDVIAPVIDFIRIRNNSPVSDEVVQRQIHQPLGAPLDRAGLEADLSRLYGLDYFSVVRYRVLHVGKQNGLEITATARENGNTWLKLGLELSDDFRGDSDFGLSASLRAAGLNRYGGTAIGSAGLGTSPYMEARFLQPLDPGLQYFVEPALGLSSEIIDIYADDVQEEPISNYRKTDYWSRLSAARLLWQSVAEMRIGIERRHSKLDFRSGLNMLERNSSSSDDGFYFVRAGIDTLDDLGFPSHGIRASVTREQHETGLEAGNNFARDCMDFTLATHLGRNILLLEADAAISEKDDAELIDLPSIGGFLELSGKPPRDRFGRHRALVRTVYYHRITDRSPLPIDFPVFVGGSLEKGNVWLNRDDISWGSAISAGSIFIGSKTPLGPAYLSIGVTNDGDRNISIFLGQRFR